MIKINSNMDLIEYENQYLSSYIASSLDRELTDPKLKDLCLHALSGGKRVRPIITLSIYAQNTNTQFSDIPHYVLDASLSVEYIHCASLILDDIMDSDTERRGKPAVHAKYGTTMAQLGSFTLCAIAFNKICTSFTELINSNPGTNKGIPLICMNIISSTIKDLCLGQYLDINLPENMDNIGDKIRDAIKYKVPNFDLNDLIDKKTSSLFELCYVIGWVYSNPNSSDATIKFELDQIRKIAKYFGRMFQIADDFEDVTQDTQRDGKNSVMNYVINKGLYEAKSEYNKTRGEFFDLSEEYDIITPEIDEIVEHLDQKVDTYFRYHKSVKSEAES